MFSICKNDCVIDFDSNNYIVLKLNSKLGFSELVLNRGPDFIKKVSTLIFLIVFTLHNNEPKELNVTILL